MSLAKIEGIGKGFGDCFDKTDENNHPPYQ
jgi:hypothetical protein